MHRRLTFRLDGRATAPSEAAHSWANVRGAPITTGHTSAMSGPLTH